MIDMKNSSNSGNVLIPTAQPCPFGFMEQGTDKVRKTGFYGCGDCPNYSQLLPSKDREHAVSLSALETAPADQTQ